MQQKVPLGGPARRSKWDILLQMPAMETAACLRALLLFVRPWLFFLAQAVLLDYLAQFLDALARFR